MSSFSDKQIKSYAESTHRFNFWVGAVRSGKTHTSILKFIDRIKNGVPGDAMIIGVNRGSIQRNILTTMYRMLGFPAPSPMCNKVTLYGRDVYLVGAPDVSAVTTIQGSTLAYALVDEATCLPEPFFKMLETRLSVQGAQMLVTCNPEGPSHWLKKQYLDRPQDHDLVSWSFSLEDNPVLDQAYKDAIRKSFKGMFYKRYVLGQWAMSTGAIFDSWDEVNVYNKDYPAPSFYAAGLDYGTVNPTSCVLGAFSPQQWPQIRIEREYYYDSKETGRQKTDAEQATDIARFIAHTPITALYVDPAAASLKIELRNRNLPVVDANNDVLYGIKLMMQLVANKNVVVHESCKNLIDQMQSYAWDPKAADKGEDKPIKQNDHAVDSLKYLAASVYRHGFDNSPNLNLTADQRRAKVFGYDDMYQNFAQEIAGAGGCVFF